MKALNVNILIVISLLMLRSEVASAQTKSNGIRWFSAGIGESRHSKNNDMLNLDVHYSSDSFPLDLQYQIGASNAFKIGGEKTTYSFAYTNIGICKNWRFVRAAAFVGPSLTYATYKKDDQIAPAVAINDNNKSKLGVGLNQNVMLILKPLKEIGVGFEYMLNLSGTGDSRGYRFVLQLGSI